LAVDAHAVGDRQVLDAGFKERSQFCLEEGNTFLYCSILRAYAGGGKSRG
jgi:hypothetical protein